MKRTIIKIDDELCNGCEACVQGCHEGALQMIDGKARLVSELFCDGLGACIGDCPVGAITLEVEEPAPAHHATKGGCPGSREMSFAATKPSVPTFKMVAPVENTPSIASQLRQWPVQLHLLNPQAGYFNNADVVLAADCVPFSFPDFHTKFLVGKTLAIACPKLDSNKESYVEKIKSMIVDSNINTLNVVIMEVPCCGSLLGLAKKAVAEAGRKVPIKLSVIGIKGDLLNEEWV